MNAKQRATWEDLVRQCESRSYNSINVASRIRSDVIVAAGKLIELVTPELPALLERLATYASRTMLDYAGLTKYELAAQDMRNTRALAARIREALETAE